MAFDESKIKRDFHGRFADKFGGRVNPNGGKVRIHHADGSKTQMRPHLASGDKLAQKVGQHDHSKRVTHVSQDGKVIVSRDEIAKHRDEHGKDEQLDMGIGRGTYYDQERQSDKDRARRADAESATVARGKAAKRRLPAGYRIEDSGDPEAPHEVIRKDGGTVTVATTRKEAIDIAHADVRERTHQDAQDASRPGKPAPKKSQSREDRQREIAELKSQMSLDAGDRARLKTLQRRERTEARRTSNGGKSPAKDAQAPRDSPTPPKSTLRPGTKVAQVHPTTGKPIRQVRVVKDEGDSVTVEALNGPVKGSTYTIKRNQLNIAAQRKDDGGQSAQEGRMVRELNELKRKRNLTPVERQRINRLNAELRGIRNGRRRSS